MHFKRILAARRLRRVKTETDKEIVGFYEARRRIELRAIKEVRVKMGIKENCDEKKKRKEPEEGEKKGMRKCEEKDKKGAHI